MNDTETARVAVEETAVGDGWSRHPCRRPGGCDDVDSVTLLDLAEEQGDLWEQLREWERENHTDD